MSTAYADASLAGIPPAPDPDVRADRLTQSDQLVAGLEALNLRGVAEVPSDLLCAIRSLAAEMGLGGELETRLRRFSPTQGVVQRALDFMFDAVQEALLPCGCESCGAPILGDRRARHWTTCSAACTRAVALAAAATTEG